ncbi:hypothetical protein OQZ33_17210 [Pedobacter sp. MC2016-05]|uniref:HEAT repeat domain-containing protein n=1 Tax=Pedobacter sp. MC2016-05 TaxID=2994474 RepID=UPI0022460F80|nr:hypothetical protein [Pedobacter sp. MC2016-05]MCX2476076.1 hypothetical protein [Pedobacter sp. MC2016-05]
MEPFEYAKMSPSQRAAWLDSLSETEILSLGEAFIHQVLSDENYGLCKWFLYRALGEFDTITALSALHNEALLPDINFGNTSTHLAIADSFVKIGQSAWPYIVSLYNAPEDYSRKIAVDVLGSLINQDDKSINIGYLREAIIEDVWIVKLWASLSLAKLGEASRKTIENLITDALVDENTSILLIDALDKIGMSDSPKLLSFLGTFGSENQKKAVSKYLLN